jgi:phenylpyruvate tautomerase PptA (4-oxalocrotonate tautomerase family)
MSRRTLWRMRAAHVQQLERPARAIEEGEPTVPFYGCNVPAGSLTDDQKEDLARAITRIHAEVTGASPVLVYVHYNELASGDLYKGGERSSDIVIAGHIRAGRSDTDKQRLLRKLAEAAAAITGRPLETFAVLLRDVPARFIFDRGDIAPELGEDDAWLATHGPGRRNDPSAGEIHLTGIAAFPDASR